MRSAALYVPAVASIAVLATAILVTAACTPAPSASPAEQVIELTEADNASARELKVGQELRVTLEANPTTGYQWAIDGSLPAGVEQLGDPVYTASSTALGSGGTEVWTFVARATGSGTLALKYWRSFEPSTPPVRDFRIEVTVTQ